MKKPNHTVERDDYADDAYNVLLLAELLLPNESENVLIQGTIIKRVKNNMGQLIGKRHADTYLDTRKYVVSMADGMEREIQN